VALFSLKEGIDQAKLARVMGRRADYEFPEGISLIGEYWTSKGSPAVLAIFEDDDAAALMINAVTWMHTFHTDVFPVNMWEKGLETLTKHLRGG
jgi:hypothetical protein